MTKTIRKKPIKKPRKKQPKPFKSGLYIFGLLFLGFICFSAGFLTYKGLDYFFGGNLVVEKNVTKVESNETKKDKFAKKPSQKKPIEKSYTQKPIELPKELDKKPVVVEPIKKPVEEETDIIIEKENEVDFIKEISQKEDNKTILTPLAPKLSKKPKLAIIIDDIWSVDDFKNIKSTNLKLTPSIFPPNRNFLNTPNLAKKSEFYMIHLPLEAINYSDSLKTLKVVDDYETIDKFIKDIRVKFPNAKFINNHTGSKFTGNLKAMKKLYKALEKYDFIFVDSKTIQNTKVKEVVKSSNHKYIYRDVFLDNELSDKAIKSQLTKAVNLAKKRGYAIAIGHPKEATFKALRSSFEILDGVEVVYLKDIYEFYE